MVGIWSPHNHGLWPDLDACEEPTDAGRRLDVGGFVFGDSPDALFRCIGETYLRDTWRPLRATLDSFKVRADDLSWGVMHPGETSVPGVSAQDPCRFIGWTSRQLAGFGSNSRCLALEEKLRHDCPQLRWAATWRSLKWRIDGDDTALGLRLFEAVATDELSEWCPDVVLSSARDDSEPWIRMAKAVKMVDQQLLDDAVAHAENSYTPIGYRVVVRGYQAYAESWKLGLRFATL